MPFASATKGQPFAIPSPNVPSDVRGVNPSLTVTFGSQKWADYNADGEMDFVMVGRLPADRFGIQQKGVIHRCQFSFHIYFPVISNEILEYDCQLL